MRIAICDDEPIFSGKLKEILHSEFKNYNIDCDFDTLNDGSTLLELCQNEKVDAVFLDIMMPGIDGYQTAEKLRTLQKQIMIVFVSNKDSEFCKSYQYSPIWFIPKNQMEWIVWAVKKIVEKYREYENDKSYINLSIGNKNIDVDILNIKYFKTEGHYIRYKNINGDESLSYRCKLSDIEDQLITHWFVKTHNRYLANLRIVQNVSEKELLFYDGESIPISRNKKNEVKDKFQDYLRSMR